MFGRKGPKEPSPREVAGDVSPDDRATRLNAENTRILGMVARDYIKDRKSRRRWSWIFRGLILLYLTVTLVAFFQTRDSSVSGKHTALVELEGLIAPTATSADEINYALRRAFDSEASGVVLRINSPGGTPVQAARINEEIYRLKEKHPDTPFYAVLSDVSASGGYYVAVAADEIYAHPSSIVGSIGVRMDSFGFVEAMDRLGIERRLVTSGDDKAMLDPFSPSDPAQVAHAERMLGEVHQQFIEVVKQGRGDRLSEEEDLFGGLFWSGERAMELGLIDEFGSVSDVARDVIGAERVVRYNPKRGLFEELSREFGVRVGDWASALLSSLGSSLRVELR